ncbi:uncharacterized protein zfp91 [Neosynchiropus ocellatus]
MEPTSERSDDVNKGEELAEDKAAEQTPAPSTPDTPRRGLRNGRSRSGVATDVNGALISPQQSSGRVLRDRSTRSVPAWLKDSKSDGEEEESADPGASKRRKVSNSRRKKNVDPVGLADVCGEVAADCLQGTDSDDSKEPVPNAQALPPRRPPTQIRSKLSAPKTVSGSAKPVFKTEPGVESQAATDEELKVKEKCNIEKKEEVDDVSGPAIVDEDDPDFKDDPNDPNFEPEDSASGADEIISSDEDLPFSDDLNDQSYDPKAERDPSKVKRKVPPRQRERERREKAPKKEGAGAEIKVEGSDNVESVEEEPKVEEEKVDDPNGPRKRGRRKKDDKTPRLPKRRKKPPVQYVRCEIEGCGTVLAHPRYLQHHIKYQHLLKKKYVCPHPSCGRLFRLQKQLLRHAKHHTDQRDYICEFCARAFKSSHNLAVHRMIHTGEKPLQCEICGFTCRQKASLNWHMKKHDADATYQFACSICGKKFEKKDCVVAHKAKSHPEVLIAEALAANAGALITTPAALLELPGNSMQTGVISVEMGRGQEAQSEPVVPEEGQQVAAVPQVGHQVVVLGQERNLHNMQVPVTISLSPIDPPSPADTQQQTHLQLQMPVQFVQAQQSQPAQIQHLTLHPGSVVTQQQPQLQPLQSYTSQQQCQGQILQMTFQPVSQAQTQIPQILPTSQQLQTSSSSIMSTTTAQHTSTTDCFTLDNPVLSSSTQPAGPEVVRDDNMVWQQTG